MRTTERNRSLKLWVVAGAFVVTAALLATLSYSPLRSLATLRKVEDFPLYMMQMYGDYGFDEFSQGGTRTDARLRPVDPAAIPAWACTVFAALNPQGDMLLGRNFDWRNRPTLLLFTHPPDGYASASMVDISYLGFGTDEPSWRDRLRLLEAPFWPFDGMNEHGLAVGMMAVPYAQDGRDPGQMTIGSLHAMRLILDHARSVDEAIALLGQYNIDFAGGPPLHYLLADPAGNSAILEFIGGEMKILRSEESWQVATNFVVTDTGPDQARSACRRYATASAALERAEGYLSEQEALDLLEDVSQSITVWSVVYNLTSGEISVAMGRQYSQVHEFELDTRAR